MTKPDQHLILILGDQLSLSLSSLRQGDKFRDVVLMAEVMAEATYAGHHKKKLVFVFSAMRHFAETLRREGWQVDYVKLEDAGNTQNLKDEVVMLGGHLDSWHAGTGATDNGAGSMVMMEAVRILKAIDVKPRRTIRIALWSGEEEGLLGSRGYVKNSRGSQDKRSLHQHRYGNKFNILTRCAGSRP